MIGNGPKGSQRAFASPLLVRQRMPSDSAISFPVCIKQLSNRAAPLLFFFFRFGHSMQMT